MQVKQLLTRTAGAMGVTAGLLFASSPLMAQMKVGGDPNTINPNAILELESAQKGLLLPRVTLTALTNPSPLTEHVAGMHVYNASDVNGLAIGEYFNDGTTWVKINSNDAYNYIEDEGAPSGACPAKTIYTDVLETSPTFGQQWNCINGAWTTYSPGTSTAFYAGNTQNDAGGSKSGMISRLGHIVVKRESNLGLSTITPGGIIQLYRSQALGGNYGGSVDLTDDLAQPGKWRVGARRDVGTLELPNSTLTGGLSFQYAGTSRMVMNQAGYLGIRTDNPFRPLHVNGSALIADETTNGDDFSAGNSAKNGILLYYAGPDPVNGNNGRAQIFVQNNADNPNIVLSKKGANNGDVFIRFSVPNTPDLGAIVRSGSNVAFAPTSDRRLKENINGTHYSIKDLMKIGVVDYNYKSDESKTRTTGFIAQDLYKIYPDAAIPGGEDEKTKPWRVDYSKLTPLLVKAVQDQQKEIESLKAQLSEMNALKAEVASIKAMLGNAEQQKSEATISK